MTNVDALQPRVDTQFRGRAGSAACRGSPSLLPLRLCLQQRIEGCLVTAKPCFTQRFVTAMVKPRIEDVHQGCAHHVGFCRRPGSNYQPSNPAETGSARFIAISVPNVAIDFNRDDALVRLRRRGRDDTCRRWHRLTNSGSLTSAIRFRASRSSDDPAPSAQDHSYMQMGVDPFDQSASAHPHARGHRRDDHRSGRADHPDLARLLARVVAAGRPRPPPGSCVFSASIRA